MSGRGAGRVLAGMVFNIQRFSIHDGPGIRTTVFLKGCSLRCFWCHNPEGIRPRAEIQLFPERCIGCGQCLLVCAQGARLSQDGERAFRRELCLACGRCAEACFAGAIELTGKSMTVEQVLTELRRDCAFYDTSGGGITLSGGEPALQAAFARAILERCRAEGMRTAIETAGNCAWRDLAALLPATDLVMLDIKHMDPAKHRWATGASNRRILANARRLARTDKPLLVRVPVVPTVNDTAEEIGAIAALVRHLNGLRAAGRGQAPSIALELLLFHRLAGGKYASLGLNHRASDLATPSREALAALAEVARAEGVTVVWA